MRILFLTNYYPPFSVGGYEQWCQEVAEELTRRGHDLHVLTSKTRSRSNDVARSGPTVHRELHLELEGGLTETMVRLLTNRRRRLEEENIQITCSLIDEIKPDAALIWGMWNVPRTVPAIVESLLPGQVAYYICDYWLTLPSAYVQRWQEGARRGVVQQMKRFLAIPFLWWLHRDGPVGLMLERPICVSQAVRDILLTEGVPVGHAQVIHGGTQVETFEAKSAERCKNPVTTSALRLVFAGRLRKDKGIETAIRALAHLRTLMVESNHSYHAKFAKLTRLDIYGAGEDDYVASLRRLVNNLRLDDVVTFCGVVPRAEMPKRLAEYDIFIFASEWEEPFARTVLEAMAAGLAVVGTTTGGTDEILIHNETGVTFTAGRERELADRLFRLVDDRKLLCRLAEQGQRAVLDGFRFERMVDELECALSFQEIIIGEQQ